MTIVSFFARLRRIASRSRPSSAFDAGVVALEAGRTAEALTLLARALEDAASPAERAAVHNKRGIAFVYEGRRPAAVEAFLTALECDARHVATIVNVGNLLLEDGAIDDAIAHYEAALRIDDRYANAYVNLGVAYKRSGRRADAVRALRQAHRLENRLKPGRRDADSR